MARLKELVWLCNNSANTHVIGGVSLLPFVCGEFGVEITDDPAIAELLNLGQLGVHSGYFEGQRHDDACPQYSLPEEAMLHAAARHLGVSRDQLHPAIEKIVRDEVIYAGLNSFDAVPEVAAKGKKEADEQDARRRREQGLEEPEIEEPAPVKKTAKKVTK